jgi:hypothetical protein
MVEPYKPPHTITPNNKTTYSTIDTLDNLGTQYTHINGYFLQMQQTIRNWDQNFDEKLEPMLARGILKEEPWIATDKLG